MIRLFSSESVTEGHPDKVCDQISDGVLDAILAKDPQARVACESIATTGMVLVMGEISCDCYVDIPQIVRSTLLEIGYNGETAGFDGNTCGVLTAIHEQSPDIALGVDRSAEIKSGTNDELDLHGAGDQGLMFGYACDETPELMPLPISLAHALSRRLAEARKSGEIPYLRPDGKSQVTVEYDGDTPVAVDTVVISTQHSEDIENEQISKDIMQKVILPVVPENLITKQTKFFINPTGRFTVGGPNGDTGLTGRKIIVDTYGGYAHHGGGCFSGKDPTKVDRSATYAARYIAKNIVAANLAKRCEVQIAYAIGVANPVSVMVDTFGTGAVDDEKIASAVNKVFDLRPEAIIRTLKLRRPIYRQLASYGHIGRTDIDCTWEHTDKTNELKKALEL